MTLSTRWALPLAVLLGIALVPTLIHSYAGLRLDDGRRAADLELRVEGDPGRETARKPDWVRRRVASDDWMERRYFVGGSDVVLFVGRSYDPKALYHHPELALAYGIDFEPRGIIDVDGLPAHALVTRSGAPHVAVYALESAGSFVTDPVRFQIRSAAADLFHGRTAMTLFFAVQQGPAEGDLSRTAVARIVRAAADAFRARP